MEHKHEHIKSLIANNSELSSAFASIVKNVKGSSLLNDIISFLDDNNVALRHIADKNKISMVSLMRKYYIACGEQFIVNSNLSKIVDSAKVEVYAIKAPSGIRIATKSEVENGVVGLELADSFILHQLEEAGSKLYGIEQYTIGEEKYKLINLLLWTIEGRLGNYKKAGFNYNYDKELGLTDTIYDLILRSAESLTKMMDWVGNTKEFNADMNKLKKASKSKYQYPGYAPDEVTADITVKQLLFYLRNNLPRNSKNERYREAMYLVLKEQQNKYFKLSPLNISFLRGVYGEVLSGASKASMSSTVDNKLKEECEQLLEARTKGLIKPEHFVFKILGTLQKSNYSSCSKKQYDIVRDALGIVVKETENVKVQQEVEVVPIISDIDAELAGASLLDISNALGSGNYQE